MLPSLVPALRCPLTRRRLELTDAVECDGHIVEGTLRTVGAAGSYPVRGAIPRFVGGSNYAATFGFQWNRFSGTQLDSVSGVPISSDRFYSYSGWSRSELDGARVLDVGCGAGRFTEVALEAGAHVVAVDYSSAVDACWANNKRFGARLNVVQGDIFSLPFEPGTFDYVYCFGVLQHTPDPARAFASLPTQLRPGGKLAIDVYPRDWKNVLWPKYWLRPVTRRMRQDRLFPVVERWVPRLLPVSTALSRVPVLGRALRYALPVVNYTGVYPLDAAQQREWAILDTFDMLSPAYDHPQRLDTVRHWMLDAGLEDVVVSRPGFIVARGRKSPDAGRDRRDAVA